MDISSMLQARQQVRDDLQSFWSRRGSFASGRDPIGGLIKTEESEL